MDTIVVIGSVTATQYGPLRFAMLSAGLKPKILRLTEKEARKAAKVYHKVKRAKSDRSEAREVTRHHLASNHPSLADGATALVYSEEIDYEDVNSGVSSVEAALSGGSRLALYQVKTWDNGDWCLWGSGQFGEILELKHV